MKWWILQFYEQLILSNTWAYILVHFAHDFQKKINIILYINSLFLISINGKNIMSFDLSEDYPNLYLQ